MRPIVLVIAATAVALAACSMPTKTLVPADTPPEPPGDAPAGPLACHNVRPPTTAPPQVTIKGTVLAAVTGAPVPGASVELFEAGTSAGMQIVGQDGAFSLQIATAGAPADVHLRVSDNNYLTTFFYPAEVVTKDITIPVQMFTTPIATSVLNDMGVTFDPTKVQFLVGAVDCNDNALAGVTVMTSPSVPVHYFVDAPNPKPDKTATVTDAATGAAVAANLAPQVVIVNASLPSPTDPSTTLTMFGHPIDAAETQGGLVQTEIRP